MIDLDSKLPNVGTTIFTTIGQLANKHQAVNLSQGFPNFEPDLKLLDLVNVAFQKGAHQYAPMQGAPALREIISEKTENLYSKHYHPDTEITITAGATQAIFTAIAAYIRAGDEVIVLKPAYDCYEPAIELFGGTVVPVALNQEDFSMDWNRFTSAIGPNTKMVIINTPHNPTGAVWSKSDMEKLEEALRNTDVIVLSDEVYEHIIFDGKPHESVAKYPDLASRSLIVSSFGKTFHVTGWKIGCCVAPKSLMTEFRKVHQFNVFAVNHPMQTALAEYLQNPNNYLELGTFYQKKRDYFLDGIKDSRFKMVPSAGTYFQLLDYSEITDEKDTLFVERLIKEHKIASIPVSVFCDATYNRKLLRFCFAKTSKVLDAATDILNVI